MKKVLFVATVESHLYSFHIPYLKWFREQGYEVHTACKKEGLEIPADKEFNIAFQRNPFKIDNMKAYKELRNIINEEKYDIIHCHTPVGGVLTRLAAKQARKNGTKVLYTAHGFHFYKGAPLVNWLLYYPVERWLARYTDTLITINEEDFSRAKNAFKSGRIEYVPGVGLDIKKFANVIFDKSDKRKELGIPEDAFVMLSVGELNKNKNHETVIRAVSEINNSKIYYIICGQGLLENYLKKIIKELALERQVKLLGYRRDIAEICKIADVFAFPSYREGLPVALMEAMVSGLPVICSDIRGNIDLIQNEKGGFLINPKDIKGFSNAIQKLYNSAELRKTIAEHNLNQIEKYSIENVVGQMEKLYNI